MKASQAVQVRIQSRVTSFKHTMDCIVADHITDKIPACALKRNVFSFPHNIKLADPQFYESSDVDILIGADLFWHLLCVGQIKATREHPTLQKTRLGWVLAGRLGASDAPRQSVQSFHASLSDLSLSQQLTRFWELEEVAELTNNFTTEEATCEQHFIDNVTRNEQGRYIVKLPIKEQVISRLGDSKGIALKRLYGIERRFNRNPGLRDQYSRFLQEYLSLGHMRAIQEQYDDDLQACYLPHHCVFKDSSRSSKIRVVFDASSQTSSGVSLNDSLLVGPVIQQDLMSIIMRFRIFRYVLVADIIKMYRQILIHPAHTRYQRILWRDDPAADVKTYELLTVTYGTSSASFLATRCLKSLAEQYSDEFPVGSLCVQRDFYMDDLLTGTDTISDAKRLRDETIELLRRGGFELSKWASNHQGLVKNLSGQKVDAINIDGGMDSSVLGMRWNQFSDTFHFSYEPPDASHDVSKRTILSEISKLFDPLGLLGPVIVLAKLILQDIWQSGVHWDESVPQDIHTRWIKLKSQLIDINQLRISRCVKFTMQPELVQIHGFCDASQQAYGACVYIRTKLADDEYRCEILCAKSRVAPLKAISLPRLELSAALLLARLISKVRYLFDSSRMPVLLWSDSTIVLNWISSPSRKWTVFVANRVGEIQRLTDLSMWRHVDSTNNPADVLSRGLDPPTLTNSTIWWHGPTFLASNDKLWPVSSFRCSEEGIPEQRVTSTVAITIENSTVDQLLGNYSNLSKICRITAYCLRFFKSQRSNFPTAFISVHEVRFALETICKAVQKQAFPEEYKALSKGDAIHKSSNLLSLSSFMHVDGLIRVGGRLKNSDLDFETRHPILLPRRHILTKRVIEFEHARSAHAGVQATMAAVRQRFWPLALRSTTRKIVQNCITCFKAKPTHSEAIMGSLLGARVTTSRPFSHCGVDYAGPLVLREGRRRNARNHKVYVSIFVCFATKAVHIELVSDLTSEAFIAALKRFISRRGKPSCMYSDNGTTFVGAQRQLKELVELVSNEAQSQSDSGLFLRDSGIDWKFIPPHAPHFGGLWEAAVKSAKHHLSRVVGKAHLTFEEMQTTLCEIEAILNSRPLTPLSEDPNDFACLTPGHFLVGTDLNSFPYSDLTDVNENRLVRWRRVEQLRQHFWRRWSNEYLHQLQERSKWKTNKGASLKSNQIILLKQPGLAPFQWLMGRVESIHAGVDGIARSASIRTARGSFTRPLAKIAILPLEA